MLFERTLPNYHGLFYGLRTIPQGLLHTALGISGGLGRHTSGTRVPDIPLGENGNPRNIVHESEPILCLGPEQCQHYM